jgi:hypothetical protein
LVFTGVERNLIRNRIRSIAAIISD